MNWYFEAASGKSHPGGQVSGTPEEFVARQFRAHIENGIDDAGLMARYGEYAASALQLKSETESRLAACRVEQVPSWLSEDAVEVRPDFVEVDLEASQEIARAYAALTEGLSEDQIPNALACKVSDLAMREKSSVALVEAVSAAREGKNENLLDAIRGLFEPLSDNPVNRAQCEDEVKGCISQERRAVLSALGGRLARRIRRVGRRWRCA